MTTTILQGHVLDVLAGMAPKSVHVVVTSPPYWGLRAYGTPPQVWGGSSECEHEWGEVGGKSRRGAAAGATAQVGNTQKRVCPPDLPTGAFCVHCQAWRGELGSEPTLDLFVAHLVEVFEGVKRVLRDDGTLWVNLGDSYSTHAAGKVADPMKTSGLAGTKTQEEARANKAEQPYRLDRSIPEGNLCMAPARFALAMQQAGWTLRSEITLCKTAPMPESVQGARWERCRVRTVDANRRINPKDAERIAQGLQSDKSGLHMPGWAKGEGVGEWADCPGCPKCAAAEGYVQRWGSGRPTSAVEKLYVFCKAGARYFYDVEAVRMPAAPASLERYKYLGEDGRINKGGAYRDAYDKGNEGMAGRAHTGMPKPPTDGGRNLWNWLPWSPEPLQAAHYAAYPRWLPRLAIQAGTSERGCCPTCGSPWLRIVDRRSLERYELPPEHEHYRPGRYPTKTGGEPGTDNGQRISESTTLGWRQSCACPPHSPVPCTALDPFSGSGTTVIEANALGRHGVGIELKPDYVTLSHKRLSQHPISLFAYDAADESSTAAG